MTFCVICKAEISEKRFARGSHFCSESCHERYRTIRRNWRASKYCRLCGREAKQKKQETALPTAHNSQKDLIEGQFPAEA